MKAIIFGANGQDGHYLTQLLNEKQVDCIGISRSGNFRKVELTSLNEISKLVKQEKPDFIFHLAANSTTNHVAWKENHDTICTGALNILESVKQFWSGTKVLLAGSGLQFQNRNEPIKESDPFEATSAYAVSRIHSAYAARYYRSIGLKVYVGYLFNHDSPLRPASHFSKLITDTINIIANGGKQKLNVGDLAVKKEYGFAGDIVKGMWTLINQDEIYEATIGTGKAYSIEDWVAYCFSLRGLHWKDHVEQLENFKAEYQILVSDPSTIFSLGWQPGTSMEELAKMMMS